MPRPNVYRPPSPHCRGDGCRACSHPTRTPGLYRKQVQGDQAVWPGSQSSSGRATTLAPARLPFSLVLETGPATPASPRNCPETQVLWPGPRPAGQNRPATLSHVVCKCRGLSSRPEQSWGHWRAWGDRYPGHGSGYRQGPGNVANPRLALAGWSSGGLCCSSRHPYRGGRLPPS